MSFTRGLQCPHGTDRCPCKTVNVRCSLWTASEWGLFDVVKEKLEGTPSCATSEDDFGYTALHFAAQHGHLQVVNLLLEAGAHVDASTCGATALHRASYSGHLPVVETLLTSGADPFKRDESRASKGELAIHKAQNQGHQDIVRLFLSRFPSLATEVESSAPSVPLSLPSSPSSNPSSPSLSISTSHLQQNPQVKFGTSCPECGQTTLRMVQVKESKLICPKCAKHR